MACEPNNDLPAMAQDPTHISVHARRVLSRIFLSRAYRDALVIDPSPAQDRSFVDAARDNADMLREEVTGQ